MKAVAAVIVNRNTREFLRDCLESLRRQDFEGGISVWVVDNGSTDGSQEMILSDFPEVNIVWNQGNVGYARACNQGIGHSVEPYVFILNSDTVLSDDTASRVVECLEEEPQTAVVGPRLLNSDGSIQYSCRGFPSITDAFVHGFLGLFRADNPRSRRYKKMDWDHDGGGEVDWVSGAFMALRREAVERVGGFDEGYFMYVEDVDLCWRMWQAGWKVLYLPAGEVEHHVGASSRMASTRMLFHHHRSMLRFQRKTYEGPCEALVDAVVAAGVAARFLLVVAINTVYRVSAALGGAKRVITPGRQ